VEDKCKSKINLERLILNEQALPFPTGTSRKLSLAKEFRFGRKSSHFPCGKNSKTPNLIAKLRSPPHKCFFATNPASIAVLAQTFLDFPSLVFGTCPPQPVLKKL